MRGALAHDALRQLRVLHDAEQPPRRAVDGAEPDVPGVRVVVRAPVPDDAQAEHVAVEGDAALEVAADQREVVQPGELHAALRFGDAHTLKPTPVLRLNTDRKYQKLMARTTSAAGRMMGTFTPITPRRMAVRTVGIAASSDECDRKPP